MSIGAPPRLALARAFSASQPKASFRAAPLRSPRPQARGSGYNSVNFTQSRLSEWGSAAWTALSPEQSPPGVF